MPFLFTGTVSIVGVLSAMVTQQRGLGLPLPILEDLEGEEGDERAVVVGVLAVRDQPVPPVGFLVRAEPGERRRTRAAPSLQKKRGRLV